MRNTITINSKLYPTLLEAGGDSLVSVYSILQSVKGKNAIIYKDDKKTILNTLKQKTKLSVTTLKRYIKELQKLKLCKLTKWKLHLTGGKKINKKYKTNKRLTIEIGNLQQTKLKSLLVRIRTLERLQIKIIQKKDLLRNIKSRLDDNIFVSLKDLKFFKRNKKNLINYNAKTILSNKGFSKLKHNDSKGKSNGFYWKKKLVDNNLIETKQEFSFIKECCYAEYINLRTFDKKLRYLNGKLYFQLVSSFKVNV